MTGVSDEFSELPTTSEDGQTLVKQSDEFPCTPSSNHFILARQ